MKFKELTQMSAEEQEKKLSELELELIKLNSQVATGTPPKNAGQLRRLKKDVARIMLIKGNKKKLDEKADKKVLIKKKSEIKRAKNNESPKK